MIRRLLDTRPRTLLALACIGAFILSMGTLAFFPIPAANKELFAQCLGALNLMIGAIAAYYWPRLAARDEDKSGER